LEQTRLLIGELGKELGATLEGEQEGFVDELENMEARDCTLRIGVGNQQGYQC